MHHWYRFVSANGVVSRAIYCRQRASILWLQHLRLMNIFHHIGKPAFIAQKLQRIAYAITAREATA